MARNRRPKIGIVGAGATGATTAHWCAAKELGDIVLIDVVEGLPQGKALDLQEAAPIERFDVHVTGSNDFAALEGADVVVITAGVARKPGMSRSDLLSTNAGIVRSASEQIARYAPDAYVIVLSNPLDTMCTVALEATGFPRNRVVGQSGILDSTRFRTFIAQELGVSYRDVSAMVLGGHGDSMVPLVRYAYAGGIPVERLLPPERIAALVERTRKGGGEIVELLKTGSAFYAPGSAVTEMVAAILRDQKRILTCAAYLDGEYGERGIFAGVPVILGGEGVERVIELDLTEEERQAFQRSCDEVRQNLEILRSLG
ncbi:MAG: malate dehydrogenase [Clostridia bacterium]|nr:malate dehydrogenase [Clostridia bacterium]MCL6521779.1 malate dehydrogenase [Bacillota bacterium]